VAAWLLSKHPSLSSKYYMPNPIKIAGTLFLFSSISLNVSAQISKPPKPSTTSLSATTSTESEKTGDKIVSINRQRALDLLDQLLTQSKGIEDDSFRIRFQVQVADTLWEYEEFLARRNFKESHEAIAGIKFGEEINAQISLSSIRKQYLLRSEVLRIIARRDPKLARELSNSTIDTQSESSLNIDGKERAMLYGQMALSLAEADPHLASDIGRVGLNHSTDPSFVSGIITLLLTLRRQYPTIADDLFIYVLTTVQRDVVNLARNIDLLAMYVFPKYGNPAIRYNLGLRGTGSEKDQVNRILVSQLLNTVFDAVMQPSYLAQLKIENLDDQSAMAIVISNSTIIQRMLPYFDLYFSDRKAKAIRSRLTEIVDSIPSRNSRVRANDSADQESVQDLLAKAQFASNQQQKDSLYSQALMQIAIGGDFDQAFSIIDRLSDKGAQTNWRSPLYRQAAEAAINKGDFDAAIRFASNLEDLQQRASILNQIAQVLYAKKSLDRAMELLNEAEQVITNADSSLEKAKTIFSIAGTAMRIDPMRGFEIVEFAINTINEYNSSKSADIWPTHPPGRIISLNFEQSLPLMAKTDFDRTLLLAQSIKKSELSLLAQLFVCRGVLVHADESHSKLKAKSNQPSAQRIPLQSDQSKK